MRALTLSLIALSLFVLSPAYAQQPNPNEVRDQLTGDAQGPAANNPQCKLFTTGEIDKYLGMAVGAGENAAGGSGCLWAGKDEESTVLVQVVAPRYYTEPSLVTGFKRLSNIGTKAWVAPDASWSAGALREDVAVVVGLSGPTATEASAVALLQETLKRHKK